MKKSQFLVIYFMLFLTGVVFADERPPFPKVEDMRNLKWQFLVSKAQLSQKEADAVQPIFMEYEKALWDFQNKKGEFFKSLMKNMNDHTINYTEVNDKFADMKVAEAMMFKNYHLKLKKVLSPEKLFKYYGAENEYKRKLLQNLPGGSPNQYGRRPDRQ